MAGAEAAPSGRERAPRAFRPAANVGEAARSHPAGKPPAMPPAQTLSLSAARGSPDGYSNPASHIGVVIVVQREVVAGMGF